MVKVKPVEVKVLSPAFSLKGWNFWDFAKGYFVVLIEKWEEVAKWGASALLAFAFFQENPVLIPIILGLVKGVLDVAHYFLVEKKA